MLWMTRLAGIIAIASVATSVRADAIGPMPSRDDCPRGAVSTVANMMSHGQHAYCAPSLCSEGASCREGFRCAVLELEVREHRVYASNGHGAAPAEPQAPTSLAEVAGTCDAPDTDPILTPAGSASGFLLSGPTTDHVPAGCHRLAVWVADPEAHCRPGDRTATPLPQVTVQSPTASGRPAIVAAPATRAEARGRREDDPREDPPAPVPSSHAPAPRAEGCGCSASSRPRPTLFVSALAVLVLSRKRRRLESVPAHGLAPNP